MADGPLMVCMATATGPDTTLTGVLHANGPRPIPGRSGQNADERAVFSEFHPERTKELFPAEATEILLPEERFAPPDVDGYTGSIPPPPARIRVG